MKVIDDPRNPVFVSRASIGRNLTTAFLASNIIHTPAPSTSVPVESFGSKSVLTSQYIFQRLTLGFVAQSCLLFVLFSEKVAETLHQNRAVKSRSAASIPLRTNFSHSAQFSEHLCIDTLGPRINF